MSKSLKTAPVENDAVRVAARRRKSKYYLPKSVCGAGTAGLIASFFVAVEAAGGFAAEVARGDVFLQQRTGAILGIAKALV